MNMLIDLLPTTLDVNGRSYPINSDFRTGILFAELMADSDLEDEEKLGAGLELFFGLQDENTEETGLTAEDLVEAIEAIYWFYRGGYEDYEEDHETGNGRSKPVMSYSHDAPYIYAAFLDQYGIDLQDVEYLHWWKFRAMMRGLSEDCKLSKIISYRATQITSEMTKNEKAFYRRMKRLYALPEPRDEDTRDADWNDALSAFF